MTGLDSELLTGAVLLASGLLAGLPVGALWARSVIRRPPKPLPPPKPPKLVCSCGHSRGAHVDASARCQATNVENNVVEWEKVEIYQEVYKGTGAGVYAMEPAGYEMQPSRSEVREYACSCVAYDGPRPMTELYPVSTFLPEATDG